MDAETKRQTPGVPTRPLPYVSPAGLITNTVGGPLYHLIHAGPNATGSRIARDVLERPAKGKRR